MIIPKGWKLVPAEADETMEMAGRRYARENDPSTFAGIYGAMLAAAPTAPAGEQPVSDPDGLLERFPGDPTLEDLTSEGLFHNAAGYSEWYKRQYHKLREHLSAPAPDGREIAAYREALEKIAPYPTSRAGELGYSACRRIAREALEQGDRLRVGKEGEPS